MKKEIWSEIVENEAVEIIIALFGVDKEFAHKLYYECGDDVHAIRKLLQRKPKEDVVSCRCKSCGRMLKDPVSIRRGYGEECFRRLQSKQCEDLFN